MEEERRKREEEERRRREEQRRLEEERRRREEQRRLEEERRKRKEEKRQRREEQRRLEEERQRQEEQRRMEEERQKQEEQRRFEEEKQKREEEERQRQEEQRRLEEERRKQEEKERRRREEEEKLRKEEQRRIQEERQRQEDKRKQKEERQRRKKMLFLTQQKASQHLKREQQLMTLRDTDREDVQKENAKYTSKESQAHVKHMKARELHLKKTEMEVERGLNMAKSKCSPAEYAKWKNNSERLSLCSQFSETKWCTEDKHQIASNASQQCHDTVHRDDTLIQKSKALHNFRKLLRKLIHMNVTSSIHSRQQLISMQATLFFRFSQKLNLNNAQEDMLLEELSHVASFLDNQECRKLTVALALFYTSADEDRKLLPSYKADLIGFFFRGIIIGCREKCFHSGACVSQCLYKYLQSCAEGVHCDKQLLQMMTTSVDASLWCVFNEVDYAISNQCTLDLRLLKQKLHYILTYSIPLLKCTEDLSELMKWKEEEDRGWQMLRHEFLQLNPRSATLWYKIEECLNPLKSLDRSESVCDKCLSCDRNAMVEALKRIQVYPSPDDIASIMKFLCYAVYKFTDFKILPRKTQMISVCMLLVSNGKKMNRLLEVLTGEGKSWIIAMFAAALGMQGKKVDIITSSSVLARRDAKAFSKFFEIFDLSVAHNTETPDMLMLSEKQANAKRAECYKKSIVYGTVGSFSADILRQEFEMKQIRCNRGFKAAIVDEVDMLMLDEGVQFTYLSHRAAVLRHIEPVLALVWTAVGQHIPLSTREGEVLFAGVPKSFYKTIFDNVDLSGEDMMQEPEQLLQFLIEENINDTQVLLALQMLLKPESEKEGLKLVSIKDTITFIQQLNHAFSFQVIPYTLTEGGALETSIADVNSDGSEATPVSVLVANEGILYPLYTQEELSQGIESMISCQCDLPSVDAQKKQLYPVLRSKCGKAFQQEEPCPYEVAISKHLDAEEVVSASLNHFKQKKASPNTMMPNSNKEDLSYDEILNFLQYLEQNIESEFPTLYCLNTEGQLVRQVSKRMQQLVDKSGLLITKDNMLCPLIKAASPTLEGTEQPSDVEELCSSDGNLYTRGMIHSLHDIILQFVNPMELLSLQLGVEDTEKFKAAGLNPTTETIVQVISSVREYLTCNVVVYTQDKDQLTQQKVVGSLKKDCKPNVEVSILIKRDGMICNLEPKETIHIPEFLKKFVANQLPTYVNSAFTALQMRENREYILKEDDSGTRQIIPVDFLNSGVIEESKRWGGGLQQMLEMKHNFQISSMSVVTNFMSHVEFFKRYTREKGLYGLSGTVGGIKDAEILRELYQLQICKIPTYRHSLRYERDTIFVQGERLEWLEQIYTILKEVTETKPYAEDLHGAAALVLCEDIHTAKEIFYFLKRRVPKEPVLYDGENSMVSIEETPKDSGDIIVATNLAGRGTDIPVTTKVNDSGGLFCLMTFLPRNRRVELQAFGRTARRGNPGVVQYVLPVTALPCRYWHGLDIATIRELKANEEAQRLHRLLDTDIKSVEVREALFRKYCGFLKTVYRALEGRKDMEIIIDTVNENWGQWLQMKEPQMGTVSLDKLLRELDSAQTLWRPPQNISPEQLPNISYHHLVKFGNQELGRKRIPHKKKEAKEAIRYYRQAISQETKFTMIAHYNRACCSLHIQEDDFTASGLRDLSKAREQIQVFIDEVSLILQCAQSSRQTRINQSGSNCLLKQMEIRMQVLQYFRDKIDETVEKIKEFDKNGDKYKVVPCSILDLIPEADLATNEELYGLSQLGLEFAFTVEKKPRFSWEALAVFVLGVLQIAAGVCITVFSAGASSQLGMGLIAEGVSDCIDGVVGMVTGKFDMKEWAISKAISIGMSIVCGGVSKFISKGAKAVKGLVKGVKAAKSAEKTTKVGKGIKKATAATSKLKDLKGMKRVAKDSWGKALKTNVKNAAKLVGKEAVQQGVMYTVGELEDKAINSIFDKIGKTIASSVLPSIEMSFLISKFDEKELGLVVNWKFISKLSPNYIKEDRVDPFLNNDAKTYFASSADRVVHSLVPTSDTFQKVAERVRSLLPQISQHVKGKKAAAILKIAEVGFVVDSLRKVEPQLRELAHKFVPELRKHCFRSIQFDSSSESEYNMDDERYSLSCVERLKKDLAQHSADKLGDAVSAVLQQNLKWMVSRGLSATVNKFAADRLSKALDVKGTKDLIEAGQKANFLRSAQLGASNSGHVDVHSINSHCDKVLNPETPGTLSEARVVAETFGCKVTIVDEKGKRECSLSPPRRGEKPEVTLVHVPPDKDHPSGHYKVKVGGKVVDVESKNKNCMFESLAHGLSHVQTKKGGESCHITGSELREKVAKQMRDNPHVWLEHISRKNELMKMKEQHVFLLTGGQKGKSKGKIL